MLAGEVHEPVYLLDTLLYRIKGMPTCVLGEELVYIHDGYLAHPRLNDDRQGTTETCSQLIH